MNLGILIPVLVILLTSPTLIAGRSVDGTSESTTHGYGTNAAKKEIIKDEYSEKSEATTIPPILSNPHEDSDENEDHEEEDFCVIGMDSESGKDDADISSEDEDCFVLEEESHEIYDAGTDDGGADQEEASKATSKLATFFPRKVNTNDVVEAENNKLIADRIKSKLVTVKPPTEKWIPDQKY